MKNLGTNGGGFFNANGSHRYENHTSLSNFLEMLATVLLTALTNTFDRMVGQPRPRMAFLLGNASSLPMGSSSCVISSNACGQFAKLGPF